MCNIGYVLTGIVSYRPARVMGAAMHAGVVLIMCAIVEQVN